MVFSFLNTLTRIRGVFKGRDRYRYRLYIDIDTDMNYKRGSRSTAQQYGGKCIFLKKEAMYLLQNSIGNFAAPLVPRMREE